MEQSDKLFEFIKGLTKSEKRFFKLYSNLYKGGSAKAYVLLFEVLDKMKKYNEKMVHKEMEQHTELKNLQTTKTYLKKHLFESLKLYHRNNDDGLQFLGELGAVQLLIGKKYLTDAEKILNKLKKKNSSSRHSLKNVAFIQGTLWELQKRKEAVSDYNYTEQFEVISEYEKTLYDLYITTKMDRLFNEARTLIEESVLVGPEQKAKFEHFLETKMFFINIEELTTIKAQTFYLYTLSVVYSFMGNMEEYLKYCEKMYVLALKEPTSFSNMNKAVIIMNLLKASRFKNTKNNFFKYIEVLEELIEKDKSVKECYTVGKYTAYCEFYCLFPDEQQSDLILTETEAFLKNNFEVLDTEDRAMLHYALSRVYFNRGNVKLAQEIIDRLLLVTKIPANFRSFLGSKVLQLLCYLELDQEFIGKRELTAFKRKLKRENIELESVNQLMFLLTKLMKNEENPITNQNIYRELSELCSENIKEHYFQYELGFVLPYAKSKINFFKE